MNFNVYEAKVEAFIQPAEQKNVELIDLGIELKKIGF